MDLGIADKKAIVCASSRGLGQGCAMALAEAGCDLVVNGRDAKALAQTAAEIRRRFGVAVIEIVGDVSNRQCRGAARGLPRARTSWSTTMAARRSATSANSTAPEDPGRRRPEHGDADRAIKAVIDGMAERGFGRIVNITSLSVYVPIAGPRPLVRRARRPHLVPGRRGPHGRRPNVTINNLLPGKLDTDRLRGPHAAEASKIRRGRPARGSRRRFRPSASARRRNSARSAPSSVPSMPAISPARTSRSTADSM